MSETKSTKSISTDTVVLLLQQILQLYKKLGPESMESLTKSYLAPAPTAETATDPAEEMMAQAFKIFDGATDSVLKGFATEQGFDLSKSENYERRFGEGYFRVIYPAIVMYMVWLYQEGQKKTLENLGEIFSSFMFGVAGYQILDSNLDEGKQNPTEILMCLSFIHEAERLLLQSFKFDPADYELLNRFTQLYLKAEIKEKSSRFIKSPYNKNHPEDCGYKAVHAYLPFALLLQKSGKQDQIDEYLQFFYEWGAPLQIMDDINDLEDDIKNGHYSYPTIGFEEIVRKQSPSKAATIIKADIGHIIRLQQVCKELIESSRDRGIKLKADLFGYFVDMLQTRLDAFFSKILDSQKTNN